VKSSDTRLLSRREFNERYVALGSLVTLSGALALVAATAVAATGTPRTVKFHDGIIVPAIGRLDLVAYRSIPVYLTSRH
jgi:hypothetical protein